MAPRKGPTITCSHLDLDAKISASLDTSAELNLGDRVLGVLGEVEKDSFITLPGKGGTAGSCLEKLCPNLEKIVSSFIVMVQGGCDQLVDILLMGGGEVNRCQYHEPSGYSWSGVHMLVGSIPSLTWRGFQYLQSSSEILLCVSIDGEPGPCPKAALLFLLTVSPWSRFPSLP